ncbi:moesin/ezrin/radixin homolog 1-like [Coccinella septempunctata]|uniref:moesin/ezrin/radixin homolog 1-like n=1 Tax=Coccinella septempunctata TaxID=41139 RepID=UPI001D087376|nr:moesin/ezrin/radixin homolog 1-like [Coccinella septempunctata]
MKVIVKSVLAETELEAPPKSLFRDIFLMICRSLGLQETWFFGLCYRPRQSTDLVWLDTSKKALKDLPEAARDLNFRIKYYPEDVASELIENITIQVFYTEVKAAILSSEIFCPADTAALLASYSLQVKFGDYDDQKHDEEFVVKQTLLPKRVIKQHDLDAMTWTESLTSMWKKLAGMDSEDAMLEYLKLAQNLDMYGVFYFDILNKKRTKLLLGVNALGLDIFVPEDQLNPQVSFPWSEIKHLTFRDTKFIIKPVDKKAPTFTFFTTSGKSSKQILNLGVGNHQLYVRRRKPDTPEVAKMREKANAVRELRENHKDKLNIERTAREEALRREMEYQKQLKKMQDELEQSRKTLVEANQIIRQLQDQLHELQEAKQELEIEQRELKSMIERLQEAKNMEAEEKSKLEWEIMEKQKMVQKIQDEVAAKDEETKRLQEQIELARRKEEEYRIQQQKAEEERLLEKARLEEEAKRRAELEAVPDNANTELPEVVKVNENLQEQLKSLQSKLEESFKKEEETSFDKIHRINVMEGRDKYKTLADIRRGNTVRRIEMFENM